MNHIQKLDESKLRRLVYIKRLFLVGVNLLERETEPDIAVALLLFDCSIEMMLTLVGDIYGIKMPGGKQNIHFPKLLEVVRDHIKEDTSKVQLQNYSDLQTLHKARNGVQHDGIIPSLSAIQRFRAIAESVLRTLTKDTCGLYWEEISLASLITDPVVSELYRRAESAYANKRHLDAAISLVAAFEFMKEEEINRRAGSGILGHRISIQFCKESSNDDIKKLANYAEAIEKEIEILKLGVDYKSYRLYTDFTQFDPFESIGLCVTSEKAEEALNAVTNQINREAPIMKNDGELQRWLTFAFPFVIENILRWQLILRPSPMDTVFKVLLSEIS